MADKEHYPKWIGKYDNMSFEEILEKARNAQSKEEFYELVAASLIHIEKKLDKSINDFDKKWNEKIKEEDVHKNCDNV